MSDNYRTEAIQIAAVAHQIVTVRDTGSTAEGTGAAWDRILQEIEAERLRQERKWGSRHYGPGEGLRILLEEVGEWAAEVLEDLPYNLTPEEYNLARDMTLLGQRAESINDRQIAKEATQDV